MPMKLFTGLAAMVAVLVAIAAPALADRLDDIKQRGKLIVGVQQDFKPWGFKNEKGEIVGLEIDLAKDLAKRLGVELQLVPIDSAFRRMQAVYTGDVDLTIAGMGDNPKRREQVGFIEPQYYASGYDVVARKSLGLKDWADLKGKKVCIVDGSWYAKTLTGTIGAELLGSKDYASALDNAQAGKCDAVAYDNTWNESTRATDPQRWKDFDQPLPTQGTGPWGIIVDKKELDSAWGKFLVAASVEWHKNGTIVDLEKKWDIKPEPWVEQQAKKYRVG